MDDRIYRSFTHGMLPLLILHLANRERVYGRGLIRRLGESGCRVSPGVLYPLLRELEHDGMLGSETQAVGGRKRRNYYTTERGRKSLAGIRSALMATVVDLFGVERRTARRRTD